VKKSLDVVVDCGLTNADATEVIVMNEQGGGFFDRFRDSTGANLFREKIGCWDKVAATEAWFECEKHGIAFTLTNVADATLYSGREMVDTRLAWSGFGYSIGPTFKRFEYTLKIGCPS
jgi:hypothetical protein